MTTAQSKNNSNATLIEIAKKLGIKPNPKMTVQELEIIQKQIQKEVEKRIEKSLGADLFKEWQEEHPNIPLYYTLYQSNKKVQRNWNEEQLEKNIADFLLPAEEDVAFHGQGRGNYFLWHNAMAGKKCRERMQIDLKLDDPDMSKVWKQLDQFIKKYKAGYKITNEGSSNRIDTMNLYMTERITPEIMKELYAIIGKHLGSEHQDCLNGHEVKMNGRVMKGIKTALEPPVKDFKATHQLFEKIKKDLNDERLGYEVAHTWGRLNDTDSLGTLLAKADYLDLVYWLMGKEGKNLLSIDNPLGVEAADPYKEIEFETKSQTINEKKGKNMNTVIDPKQEFENGKLKREIYKDANGKVTKTVEYAHDDNGKVTESREYTYDDKGNKIQEVVKQTYGSTWEYTYDANGDKTREVWEDIDGTSVETVYDNQQLIRKVYKYPNGYYTEEIYDNKKLTREICINPDKSSEETVYDNGQMTCKVVKDVNGNVTDGFGPLYDEAMKEQMNSESVETTVPLRKKTKTDSQSAPASVKKTKKQQEAKSDKKENKATNKRKKKAVPPPARTPEAEAEKMERIVAAAAQNDWSGEGSADELAKGSASPDFGYAVLSRKKTKEHPEAVPGDKEDETINKRETMVVPPPARTLENQAKKSEPHNMSEPKQEFENGKLKREVYRDANGKVTKSYEYDTNGKVTESREYTYDDNGHQISAVYKFPKQRKIVRYETDMTKGIKGGLTTVTEIWTDQKKTFTHKEWLDENGVLKKEGFIESNKFHSGVELDSQGNQARVGWLSEKEVNYWTKELKKAESKGTKPRQADKNKTIVPPSEAAKIVESKIKDKEPARTADSTASAPKNKNTETTTTKSPKPTIKFVVDTRTRKVTYIITKGDKRQIEEVWLGRKEKEPATRYTHTEHKEEKGWVVDPVASAEELNKIDAPYHQDSQGNMAKVDHPDETIVRKFQDALDKAKQKQSEEKRQQAEAEQKTIYTDAKPVVSYETDKERPIITKKVTRETTTGTECEVTELHVDPSENKGQDGLGRFPCAFTHIEIYDKKGNLVREELPASDGLKAQLTAKTKTPTTKGNIRTDNHGHVAKVTYLTDGEVNRYENMWNKRHAKGTKPRQKDEQNTPIVPLVKAPEPMQKPAEKAVENSSATNNQPTKNKQAEAEKMERIVAAAAQNDWSGEGSADELAKGSASPDFGYAVKPVQKKRSKWWMILPVIGVAAVMSLFGKGKNTNNDRGEPKSNQPKIEHVEKVPSPEVNKGKEAPVEKPKVEEPTVKKPQTDKAPSLRDQLKDKSAETDSRSRDWGTTVNGVSYADMTADTLIAVQVPVKRMEISSGSGHKPDHRRFTKRETLCVRAGDLCQTSQFPEGDLYNLANFLNDVATGKVVVQAPGTHGSVGSVSKLEFVRKEGNKNTTVTVNVHKAKDGKDGVVPVFKSGDKQPSEKEFGAFKNPQEAKRQWMMHQAKQDSRIVEMGKLPTGQTVYEMKGSWNGRR